MLLFCSIKPHFPTFAPYIMRNTLLFFLFSFSLFCQAQKTDTAQFYTNYAGTGNWNKTNVSNSFLLNNLLKFNVLYKSFAFNTTNGYTYGKQAALLTNDDYTSSLDVNLFKTVRHFYYWGLANYTKSYSLKIENRLQSGFGVGYSIINKTGFVLGLSDGFLFEDGHLYDAQPYRILRNSFRIKYKIVYKTYLTFDGTHFFQPSLLSFEDYVITSNSSLSVKLNKWLSLTSSLTYNKLNLTGAENLLVTFGLTVEKYF